MRVIHEVTFMKRFLLLGFWCAIGISPIFAQQSAQPTFPTAADACQMLVQAVENNDGHAIARILGGPTELASSRDDTQDKTERELFVQKYQEMHRLGRDDDGSLTLYIGPENWPFPVPLVKTNGVWRFDPDAGAKEVLYRRIGENELTALAASHEFIAAKKHNPAPAQSDESSPVVSLASDSGDAQPVLFHGYYFRVLQSPKSGGFVLIAYPAEYRSSGVMSFAVTDQDIVYEKDLGANASSLASGMKTLKKDATWRAAETGK